MLSQDPGTSVHQKLLYSVIVINEKTASLSDDSPDVPG